MEPSGIGVLLTGVGKRYDALCAVRYHLLTSEDLI